MSLVLSFPLDRRSWIFDRCPWVVPAGASQDPHRHLILPVPESFMSKVVFVQNLPAPVGCQSFLGTDSSPAM